MPLPHPVALLGFRAFERSALDSYFRLAANRAPAYEQVERPADAQFIIADAEQPDAVAAVRAAGRMADTVFVGSQPPPGAALALPRPIDPLKVLRELDMLAARLQPAAPGPDGPRTIIRMPRRAPAPPPPAPSSGGSGFVAVPTMLPPPAPPPPRQGRQALLVDDSEIALRHLETRLQQLGLLTERAGTSGQALQRLSQARYDVVFIDVDLGEASELDGLALCQHLKRHHHHVGDGQAPLLAIVSAFQGEQDRARGVLAGADAYFGKPVDEVLLAAWLGQHGIVKPI